MPKSKKTLIGTLIIFSVHKNLKFKLIVFQFKLLHRRLTTNSFLTKINLKDNEQCAFCQNDRETLRITCILCTSRPIYQSTYRPMYRSTYRSICRPTYRSRVGRYVDRPRCVGRHIDRHIGRASVDMSTDTRPICWPIRRPRVIVRLSADMSIDRLPTFRRYFTATCPGCVTCNKIHIASYHYLRTFWERCFSEDSYKSGIVNRTNLTKNQLNLIKPNWLDCCLIGSVIAHN